MLEQIILEKKVNEVLDYLLYCACDYQMMIFQKYYVMNILIQIYIVSTMAKDEKFPITSEIASKFNKIYKLICLTCFGNIGNWRYQ